MTTGTLKNWSFIKISDIFDEVAEKNHPDAKVLTIVQGIGTVLREDSGREIIYDKNSLANYKFVRKGDFIIHLRSFEGGLEVANQDGLVSPAYIILRPKIEASTEYLYPLFHSNRFINQTMAPAVEGARDGRSVKYDVLQKQKIPFPPLPEQQKIAEVLSTQDKVIELKEKLLEQKQTQKKWLMQKLFSNDGTTFTLGGVRIDKSGWKNTKLGDVCFFINGKAYKQEELLSEGKYKVLRVGNLFTNENWYYSDLELSENKYIDHGDLIFAWSTSFCPIIWGGEKVIYHYHIWKLEITGSIKQEYLYYALLFDVNLLTNETQGGTMSHITKENMEKREILISPLPEQQAIAEVLSTADKEIDLLKSEIEQEKLKKKSLMQLLLTGIVRVKV